MKTASLFRVSLLALLAFSAESALGADARGLRVSWTSNNSRFEGLKPEVDDLYISLRNQGLLPVKRAVAPENWLFVSEAFSDLFVHSDWTTKLDNLLCDLNPNKCVRPRELELSFNAEPASHINGFRFTLPRFSVWQLAPGDEVAVPDVPFALDARWVSIPLAEIRKDGLASLYSEVALGCDAAKNGSQMVDATELTRLDKLKELLAARNPADCPLTIFENNAYDFGVALGKRSRGADLNDQTSLRQQALDSLRSANTSIRDASTTGEAWSELENFTRHIQSSGGKTVPVISLPVTGLSASFSLDPGMKARAAVVGIGSDDWRRSLLSAPPAKIATGEEFEKLLVRPASQLSGWVSDQVAQSGAGGTPALFVKPPRVRAEDVFAPGSVVVVDRGVDLAHCIFKDAGCGSATKVIDLQDPFESDPSNYPDPAAITALFRSQKDSAFHGLQVAALVGGKAGGYGVDPLSNLVPFEMDFAAPVWTLDNVQALKATLKLSGAVVWNLSGHTLVQNSVAGIAAYAQRHAASPSRFLFVASAGNMAKANLPNGTAPTLCNIYPACLVADANPEMARTIITVVGVMENENGQIVPWQNSEFGSFYHPEFQIAAPADGFVVPSGTPGISFRESGVSYAVPLVSGTLSALRAREMLPATLQVGRLMACGVNYLSLIGKVKGGVLDSACTVDLAHDQVSFTRDIKGQEKDVYKALRAGRIRAIWNQARDDQVAEFPIGNANSKISGDFRLYPDESRDSILGYRQFGDDPNLYKLTVWDEREERIRTESVNALSSKLVVEFVPVGETTSVCFEISAMTNFVPRNLQRTAEEEHAVRPLCPQ